MRGYVGFFKAGFVSAGGVWGFFRTPELRVQGGN